MKVVILAAGLGTRFLPATKSMPKEMLPVVNRPVIQYVVEEAIAAGGDDILIVTGRGKRAVEDHFDHNPDLGASNDLPALRHLEELSRSAMIHYVRQRAPLGLANAVSCAERHIGQETFGVLLGDSIHECDPPLLVQLRDVQARYGPHASAVALEPVPVERVSSYGIVGGREVEPGVLEIDRLVEKPAPAEAPSHLAITGAYFLSPTIFEVIRKTPRGKKGEVELTDALNLLLQREKVYGVVLKGRRYDTGTPVLWLEANLRFALRDPELRKPLEAVFREPT
jgi:UTP--glucose-1-phosphate uridylyltransferase